MAERGDVGRSHRSRRDRQPPVLVHRVAGVDREIGQHLLELARVGTDDAGAVVPDDQVHTLAGQLAQQGRDAGDDVGQAEDLRSQRLLPREGEQLPRQLGRADRVLPDLVEVVEVVATRGVTIEQLFAKAENGGQDIVEIVRDPPRELADRLHLGGLRDLLFEADLFANIAHRDDRAEAPAGGGAGDGDDDAFVGPHLEAQAALLLRGACRQDIADRDCEARTIRRHRERKDIAVGGAIAADRLGEDGVGQVAAAAGVEQGDPERQRVENGDRLGPRADGVGDRRGRRRGGWVGRHRLSRARA